MELAKAQLKAKSGGDDIIFMFNPKELSFQAAVQTTDNPGARATRSGRPRVSFSDLPPRQIAIQSVLFDTYETGKDVISEHMQAFLDAAKFSEDRQRPPVYSFIWGSNIYFDYCFIAYVSYRLTKFLPDGKAVRAIIDTLVLKETEKPSDDDASAKKPKADPADERGSRS
ncbi:MAG: hypothetical protein AAFV85_23435 [Cyanobacteria bacterium J06634_6]